MRQLSNNEVNFISGGGDITDAYNDVTKAVDDFMARVRAGIADFFRSLVPTVSATGIICVGEVVTVSTTPSSATGSGSGGGCVGASVTVGTSGGGSNDEEHHTDTY